MSDSKEMIKLKINGIEVTAPKGTNLLEVAKMANIKIPHLCYHPDLKQSAACGLCLVRIGDSPKLARACVTEALEGMDVHTSDSEIYQTRKTVLSLILSNHPDSCLSCSRNQNCELQRLAAEFGIRNELFDNISEPQTKDDSTPALIVDPEKCVLCGRCVEVCQNKQNVNALEFIGRGFDMKIAPAGDIKLADGPCVNCGQCSAHCPVGAIVERSDAEKVYKALENKDLYPVVQIAPAVRVAIGEAFGFKSGEITTGKIYALLRRLGFKAVFDTNMAADVTIMEEGSEFVEKFKNKPESLPLITSCCPAWVDYLEKYYTDTIEHFSSAHSPQEMMGALTKTYYAEQAKIDPKNIYMVSIMPCTAKKFEITRTHEMSSSGYQNVDVVLTTRELVRMAKSSGIEFEKLEEETPDSVLATYSGAGTIFGATGGVMEAAIRSAYYLITNEELENIDLVDIRGQKGVKEATIDIKGTKVNVAVAHGLKNVAYVMDQVREAKKQGKPMPYHFIEVMACEGGCVSGGGQPYGTTSTIRQQRGEGLYADDRNQKVRCSHNNPEVQKLYKDYLNKIGHKKTHELLHTSYQPRPLYLK